MFPALLIVLELARISIKESFVNFGSAVKIAMNMIKTNEQHVLNSPVLCQTVKYFSEDFSWIIKTLHQSPNDFLAKIANVHLKLLKNILAQYSGSEAITLVMIKTFSDLTTYQKTNNLSEPLNGLVDGYKQVLMTQNIWNLLKNTEHLEKDQIECCYYFCLDNLKTQHENGKLVAIGDSNMQLLIDSLSRDILILPSAILHQIKTEIVNLLRSGTLQPVSFQKVEQHLVRGIMQGNVICFTILRDFAVSLNTSHAFENYYKFFQNLLLKFWTPPNTPTIASQIYLMSIVKSMLNRSEELRNRDFVRKEVLDFFMKSPSSDEDYLKDYDKVVSEQTIRNYYKLVKGLQSIERNSTKPVSKQQIESFLELMKIMSENDSIDEMIALKIMDIIIAKLQIDKESKMYLLVKLYPLLYTISFNSESLQLKLKFLDLIYSLEKDSNGTVGIAKMIEKGLDKLSADPDLGVKRAVCYRLKNHFKRTNQYCKADSVKSLLHSETKFDSSSERSQINPIKLHVCETKLKNDNKETNETIRLRKIEEYTKSLRRENLSSDDRRCLQRIIQNSTKLLQAHE